MDIKVVWRRAPLTPEGKQAAQTTALRLGKAFHLQDTHVVVGTQQGSILFLPLFELQSVRLNFTQESLFRMRTDYHFDCAKPGNEYSVDCQGASIRCLELCNLTNKSQLDLIAGDSGGNILAFSGGVKIASAHIDQPVSALTLDRDLCMCTPNVLV